MQATVNNCKFCKKNASFITAANVAEKNWLMLAYSQNFVKYLIKISKLARIFPISKQM